MALQNFSVNSEGYSVSSCIAEMIVGGLFGLFSIFSLLEIFPLDAFIFYPLRFYAWLSV